MLSNRNTGSVNSGVIENCRCFWSRSVRTMLARFTAPTHFEYDALTIDPRIP